MSGTLGAEVRALKEPPDRSDNEKPSAQNNMIGNGKEYLRDIPHINQFRFAFHSAQN